MSPDVLVSGRERAPASRRRTALPLVLVLLAGLLYVGDSQLQRHEVDRLLVRAADAQATIAYTDRRVAATVSYTLPLLISVRTSPSVRAGLARLVEQEAAGQVAAVQRARTAGADVRVLPWHARTRRARDLLVAYLDVRIGYLRDVSRDARTLYRPHPELERALDRARAAFLAAADAGTDRRVTAVFPGDAAGGAHPAGTVSP